MHHFPRVEDDPGLEEWLKPKSGLRMRCFMILSIGCIKIRARKIIARMSGKHLDDGTDRTLR
eukprot:382879-Pleurochrysis_carterae.AAC.1